MKLTTKDMILSGLFAALMAVGAYIKIPNPINPAVPITFQLFFCIYAGLLLGKIRGGLSQLIYMLIGLAGAPVFAGGLGIAYILDYKFGFIIGFVVCALVVGALIEKQKKITVVTTFLIALVGFGIIYLIGDTYMYLIMKFYLGKDVTWFMVHGWMLSFMVKDLMLLVIIAVTSVKIIPIIKKAGYLEWK